MKKYSLLLLAVFMVVALLGSMIVGCTPEEPPAPTPTPTQTPTTAPTTTPTTTPTTAPTTPPPPPYEWPDQITATAMGLGSSEYARYLAWATEFEADTGTKLRVFPVENTQTRYQYIKSGDSTLASSGWNEWIAAFEADGMFATRLGGPLPIRATLTSTELPFIAYTTADSDIMTYKDITEDTRLAIAPFLGLVVEINGKILPAAAGIDPDKANIVSFGSYGAEALSVIEGTADIAVSVPAGSYTQQVASSARGIRVIDMNFDAEAAARVAEVNPLYNFGPATEGVEEAIGKNGLFVVGFYHTRAETDPDVVYNWVKWMIENHATYAEKTVGFQFTTVERTLANLVKDPEPAHEGAVRYFKELGLWTDAMEKQNNAKIAIIDAWVEGYAKAITEADDKKIKIDPENQEWIDL